MFYSEWQCVCIIMSEGVSQSELQCRRNVNSWVRCTVFYNLKCKDTCCVRCRINSKVVFFTTTIRYQTYRSSFNCYVSLVCFNKVFQSLSEDTVIKGVLTLNIIKDINSGTSYILYSSSTTISKNVHIRIYSSSRTCGRCSYTFLPSISLSSCVQWTCKDSRNRWLSHALSYCLSLLCLLQ